MKKMTKLAIVLTSMFLNLVTNAQQITNYLCDTLAPALKHPLDTIPVSFANQIVTVEGQPSNPYSSVRGESDYFVVPTTHTNGGRILRMRPFSTSDFRPWYGIEETNVVFTDQLSQEVFTAPLVEVTGLLGDKLHHSTLVVDGMNIYIKVYYALTPRYPSTILTWGLGAGNGLVGSAVDITTCPPEPEIIPTNKVVGVDLLSRVRGTKLRYAHILTLERPLHAKHRIEASTKGKTWQAIETSGIFYNLLLNQLVIRGNTNWKHFRIVTIPPPVSPL